MRAGAVEVVRTLTAAMSEQRGQKRSSQSRAERGSLKRARMSLNSPEMEDEEEDAGEYSDVDMSQVPTQEIQRYDAKSTIQLSSVNLPCVFAVQK